MLGDTPVDTFKCLRKTKTGYEVDTQLPAFEKQVGKKYGEFEVRDINKNFYRLFKILKDYSFSPVDDDLKEYLRMLKEYFAGSGKKYMFEIKSWPARVPRYSGKYTLEKSLEVLLLWIDEIMAISEEEVQYYIDNLPRNKTDGAIKTNKNIVLKEASFFVPRDGKFLGKDKFDNIATGGIPNMMVRTPMNYPLREIAFSFGVSGVYLE